MRSRIRAVYRVVRATVTPLGWTAVVVGALAWIVGSWFGWAELHTITTMVLALAVMAVLFTIGRIALSSTVSVAPSRVVVGTRALGELRVRNKRRRSIRGLQVEFPVGNQVAYYGYPVVRGDEEIDEQFVVPTQRRAIIPVGPITTVQGDPLGLLRRTQVWSGVEEIFVHPLTVGLTGLSSGLIRDLEGQATSQLSPSDVAFHTLRDYVPGDDPRHIHWKSSAKHGTLQIRQYVDTRRSHIAVVLSVDPADYAGDDEFELAVSCAASVATQTMRDEQTLSVFAGPKQLTGTTLKGLLDRYSGVEPTPASGGVVECMKVVRGRAADASLVVLCTGSVHPAAQIQAATRYLPSAAAVIAFRAELEGSPRMQRVGSSVFMTVPTLDSLRAAVATIGAP